MSWRTEQEEFRKASLWGKVCMFFKLIRDTWRTKL